MFSGRVDSPAALMMIAEAARSAAPSSRAGGPADLLLDGLAMLVTEGRAAGTPVLARAVRAFCDSPPSPGELRWLWLACRVAFEIWDDESWSLLSVRQLESAREAGALAVLPTALMSRIGVHLEAGRLASATELVHEQEVVMEVTGTRLPSYRVVLAALQGREAEVSDIVEATKTELASRGDEHAPTLIHVGSAILYNGLGRYDDALPAARRATSHRWGPDVPIVGLAELIEAAARTGEREEALDALSRLSVTTRAAGTDWALGIEARCRALVSEDQAAERLYRAAIDSLGRTSLNLPLARAHLLYGEWLRREARRLDAREELRTAHEMYSAMGVSAHAERAARELQASGETARKRTAETRGELTPQEAQIARLARDGLSNPEIGTRLFISPHTVQYHLRKVFAKLGIRSRGQLDRALPRDP
jgi:DNA-binding CsgD family transcriptional regulator